MLHLAPAWLRVGLRLVQLSLFALAVLLGTSFLFAIVLALFDEQGIFGSVNLLLGVVCGLIVWLFIAAIHLRRESLTVPAPQRERFLHDARLFLTEMGYQVTSRGPSHLSTQPRFQSLLFGGDVEVLVEGTQARLVGPKVCIELLRSRLRIQSHLAGVHRALREQHRFTETLIKRAELRLRVQPEQLEAVRTNIIEVLQEAGQVVCELHLLVQSDAGVPESLLEFQVNQWLADQKIDSTLHKHFIQLHRPVGSGEVVLEGAV